MKLAQWLKSRAFRTQKDRRLKRVERRPRLVERLEDRSLMATLPVTLGDLNGWMLSTTDGGSPPNTASIGFVSGPATPPIPPGSGELSVGANGNGAAQFRTAQFNATELTDLTTLSYSTYVQQDGSGGQAPYILLNVDYNDGGTTTDDLLFFEPVYQDATFFPSNPQASIALDTWQTWDALNGGWWSLNNTGGAGPGVNVKPLATIIAAQPAGSSLSPTAAGALRLVAGFGAGAWDNFIGNVDNVTVGVSGANTTYDFGAPLPTVYVDDDWASVTPGSDPDGAGPAQSFGFDSFATIQGGVNGVAEGGTVIVATGTYDEDVNVNKDGLSVLGAGAAGTTIRGIIGGDGATVRVNADNVTVAGFTITRLGNNPTDWNNPGLNSAGVAIIGTALTGMVVRDNIITGNRTAIDVNNSSSHTIRNNVIDNNRTGLIFRNQTDNLTVVENQITDNWTVGVLFLDASGGTNSPVQTALNSTFSNNNISGNWYGQIVDRQSGGSLPAPGTTNLKNFSGNWLGSTTPVITTANSAEPGYAAQIPVAFGGTAVPPGGQPDVAGPASANFDITPLLGSGSDTDVETTPGRGTFGFQGDFSDLYVTDELAQTGSVGRIQEGIDRVTDSTVHVAAGTYNEQVTITKSVDVIGSVDAMNNPTTILTFNASGGDLVNVQGAAFLGSKEVNISNFAFQGNGASNIDNGLFVSSTARLDKVSVTNSTFGDFDINGVAVFGDTANAGLSVGNVVLSDVQFTDNGYQNIGGAGDINLFTYNGDASLSDLVLTNVGTGARGGIQMRGVGSNTTTGADILPLGSVSLDNVDISGTYRNYMLTLQRYSDAAGLSLNDVALGGAGSALSGTFGAALRFDAVGTGTPGSPDTVDLGNTYFRGLATYSPVFDIEFAPDNTFAFLRADGTDTRWNTTTGGGVNVAAANLSLAQAFEVEDRILHYVEPDHPTHLKPFKGWVEVVDGNAYVTATFNSIIQRGIEMVDAGGTVNVKSGSYTGNVDATASGVNKAISLAAGSSPGQVTINGNLALDANDTLLIEIEGTNAASAFDNFLVTGSISLGGATLALSGGYVPVNGDSFTILNGSTGLNGMFAGLNDGDELTFNGKTLEIRYVAGLSNVVLTAVEAPAITSAASATFAVAVFGSFTVTTDGFPTPDLSASGALPSGVTFVDNGDGTATLAGTPAVGSDGTYSIVITASNGVSPNAVQNFTLIVSPLAAGNAFILPDPCDPSEMALVITGTSGNDKIEVKRKNHTQVQVTINNKKVTLQAAAFEHIYVYGGNGNDAISIQYLINKEAFLLGEAGRDTIKAGGGRTVLVGGSGDDSLTGGKRRDVLIGGTGKDAITGVIGDDIVIAGTTDHDTNEMALCEILEEWSSGDDYSTRRATLSGTEATPGLLHVSKVHDDGVEDKLEKTKDLDWYFANVAGGGVKDKVVKPNLALITDI